MLQLLCSLRRTVGILVKLSTNWCIHIQDIQSFRTITYPLKIFGIVSYTKSLRGPRSGWAELAEPWRDSGPLYSVNVTAEVMKLSTYNSQFEKNFVFEYQITQRPLDKEPGPGRARRALVYYQGMVSPHKQLPFSDATRALALGRFRRAAALSTLHNRSTSPQFRLGRFAVLKYEI